MSKQPEAILEENLIKQLVDAQYEKVLIKDDKDLYYAFTIPIYY